MERPYQPRFPNPQRHPNHSPNHSSTSSPASPIAYHQSVHHASPPYHPNDYPKHPQHRATKSYSSRNTPPPTSSYSPHGPAGMDERRYMHQSQPPPPPPPSHHHGPPPQHVHHSHQAANARRPSYPGERVANPAWSESLDDRLHDHRNYRERTHEPHHGHALHAGHRDDRAQPPYHHRQDNATPPLSEREHAGRSILNASPQVYRTDPNIHQREHPSHYAQPGPPSQQPPYPAGPSLQSTQQQHHQLQQQLQQPGPPPPPPASSHHPPASQGGQFPPQPLFSQPPPGHHQHHRSTSYSESQSSQSQSQTQYHPSQPAPPPRPSSTSNRSMPPPSPPHSHSHYPRNPSGPGPAPPQHAQTYPPPAPPSAPFGERNLPSISSLPPMNSLDIPRPNGMSLSSILGDTPSGPPSRLDPIFREAPRNSMRPDFSPLKHPYAPGDRPMGGHAIEQSRSNSPPMSKGPHYHEAHTPPYRPGPPPAIRESPIPPRPLSQPSFPEQPGPPPPQVHQHPQGPYPPPQERLIEQRDPRDPYGQPVQFRSQNHIRTSSYPESPYQRQIVEPPREMQRDMHREPPRDPHREQYREPPRDPYRDPREPPREPYRDQVREMHRDPRELQREYREPPRDVPRELMRDPRERMQEPPREPMREPMREMPRDPRDMPRELQREPIREPMRDPREMRDPRDLRDPRDPRDPRDMRDPRDPRDQMRDLPRDPRDPYHEAIRREPPQDLYREQLPMREPPRQHPREMVRERTPPRSVQAPAPRHPQQANISPPLSQQSQPQPQTSPSYHHPPPSTSSTAPLAFSAYTTQMPESPFAITPALSTPHAISNLQQYETPGDRRRQNLYDEPPNMHERSQDAKQWEMERERSTEVPPLRAEDALVNRKYPGAFANEGISHSPKLKREAIPMDEVEHVGIKRDEDIEMTGVEGAISPQKRTEPPIDRVAKRRKPYASTHQTLKSDSTLSNLDEPLNETPMKMPQATFTSSPAPPPPPPVNTLPTIPPPRVINNSEVLASLKDFERHHLGSMAYTPTILKKSGSVKSYSHIPLFQDRENCTFSIRISAAHLSVEERERVCKKRLLWGADVYSDDTNILAALIHEGYVPAVKDKQELAEYASAHDAIIAKLSSSRKRGAAHRQKEIAPFIQDGVPKTSKKVEAGKDLLVTIVICGTLGEYASIVRYGLKSRSWEGHDGMSFMIEDVKWVDGASQGSGYGDKRGVKGVHERLGRWEHMRRVNENAKLVVSIRDGGSGDGMGLSGGKWLVGKDASGVVIVRNDEEKENEEVMEVDDDAEEGVSGGAVAGDGVVAPPPSAAVPGVEAERVVAAPETVTAAS